MYHRITIIIGKHQNDYLEKITNTIGNDGDIDTSKDIQGYPNNYSNLDNSYISESQILAGDYQRGNYVHPHGRYHLNPGLYNLNDLFVSASHLGDRYDRNEWNTYQEEQEDTSVIYRRGYEVTNNINKVLGTTGNSSTVTSPSGSFVSITDNDDNTYTLTTPYVSTNDTIWHAKETTLR